MMNFATKTYLGLVEQEIDQAKGRIANAEIKNLPPLLRLMDGLLYLHDALSKARAQDLKDLPVSEKMAIANRLLLLDDVIVSKALVQMIESFRKDALHFYGNMYGRHAT